MINILQFKANLNESTLRCAHSLMQETDQPQQQDGLLVILLWLKQSLITQQEFNTLYQEWCNTFQNQQQNPYLITSTSIDPIFVFLLQKGVEQDQIQPYIISFLDSLNDVNNRQIVINDQCIDDLESIYQYFDYQGLGCFSIINASFLWMVLELCYEKQSDSVSEFLSNFYQFLKDIRQCQGYVIIIITIKTSPKISLRNFKSYMIQNHLHDPIAIKRIRQAIKELLGINKLMHDSENLYFIDIFDIALNYADEICVQNMQQRQLLRNYLTENYFKILEQINSYDLISVNDNNKFIKVLIVDMTQYYGKEFLQSNRVTINTVFVGVFLDTISEFFKESLQQYLNLTQIINTQLNDLLANNDHVVQYQLPEFKSNKEQEYRKQLQFSSSLNSNKLPPSTLYARQKKASDVRISRNLTIQPIKPKEQKRSITPQSKQLKLTLKNMKIESFEKVMQKLNKY